MNYLEYYEPINCYSYYHNGSMKYESRPIKLILTGFSITNMYAISEFEFEVNDTLILNLYIDNLPFEKLMANITCVKKVGEMYKYEILVLGTNDVFYKKIREYINE
jgi:hypothetical protein